MTTMLIPLSPFHAVIHAVRDLLGIGGYGTVEYQVNDEGDFVHARTVATAKPRNEAERSDLAVFLARLHRDYDLRRDDTLQLRYDDGKLIVALITRQSR